MHRGVRGAICGCGFSGSTSTAATGSVTADPDITPKEQEVQQLWNIAGVASELSVTPQAASSWHRGPEATPPPSFKVGATGLELWTIDDIELWHKWVEARDAAAKAAKAKTITKGVKTSEDSVEHAVAS